MAEEFVVELIGRVEVGHVGAGARQGWDAGGEGAEDARGAGEEGDVDSVGGDDDGCGGWVLEIGGEVKSLEKRLGHCVKDIRCLVFKSVF